MDSALKAAQQVEAGKVSQQSLEIFNRPHPRPRAYTRSGRRTSAATPVAGWSPTAPRRASSSRGNWNSLVTPAARPAGESGVPSAPTGAGQGIGEVGVHGARRRRDGSLLYRKSIRGIVKYNPVKSDRHAESSKALSASKQMRPGPVAGAVPRAYASRGKRKTKECRHHFKEE